jgi:hypothetical protein
MAEDQLAADMSLLAQLAPCGGWVRGRHFLSMTILNQALRSGLFEMDDLRRVKPGSRAASRFRRWSTVHITIWALRKRTPAVMGSQPHAGREARPVAQARGIVVGRTSDRGCGPLNRLAGFDFMVVLLSGNIA